MMNNKKILEYSYNPQVTADSSFGIIISNDVSSEVRDVNQLQPQIMQAEENVGTLPEGTKVSADYGYSSSKNLKLMKKKGHRSWTGQKENQIILSAKRNLNMTHLRIALFAPMTGNWPSGSSILISQRTKMFGSIRELIVNNVQTEWVVQRIPGMERWSRIMRGWKLERREMADKMLSREGSLIYQTRKKVVECIFGHIKRNLGFREFLLRVRIWDEYGTFWMDLVK